MGFNCFICEKNDKPLLFDATGICYHYNCLLINSSVSSDSKTYVLCGKRLLINGKKRKVEEEKHLSCDCCITQKMT